MDPPTIVKSFKYSSSQQQPMFSVLEPPLHHYRSSSSPPNNSSTYQDISFSSYLKPKDPDSQKHKDKDVVYDTEISIFDAQKYFSEVSSDMKKQQEVSHDMNPSVLNPRLSSVSSADGYGGRNFRTRSFHATPTASSEASWNSQTGLLVNPPGSAGVHLRNVSSEKRSSVARKWIFGRKCCCTGKKSVEVKGAITSDSEHGTADQSKANHLYAKRDSYKPKTTSTISHRSSLSNDILEIQQHKPPNPLRLSPENDHFPDTDPPRQQRISASGRPFLDGAGGFSFPILNTSTQVAKPVLKAKPVINLLEDPPRDSLEVFQPMQELPSVSRPPLMDNPVSSRPHFNPGSPIARVTNIDDDVASDASSDLFEIESFSTQTTSYPMYRRRDSLDEAPTFNARRFASANGLTLNTTTNNTNNIQYGRRSLDEPPTPSVAATECYAPSEVSIDWSVTTAEGFDRASVSNFSVSASEIGTAAFLRQRQQQQQEEGECGKRKGNGGGGLLLMSCRQEKAVNVGPQPVKCVPAEGPPMFGVHVGGRPPRASKPPLGSDHSARMSVAFAA